MREEIMEQLVSFLGRNPQFNIECNKEAVQTKSAYYPRSVFKIMFEEEEIMCLQDTSPLVLSIKGQETQTFSELIDTVVAIEREALKPCYLYESTKDGEPSFEEQATLTPVITISIDALSSILSSIEGTADDLLADI